MRSFDLALHGHGLLPGLLAVHLLSRDPDQALLLLGGDGAIGGEALEPVLVSSLSPAARVLVDGFTVARWPGYFTIDGGDPAYHHDEVLLLDPVQVWLELQVLLPTGLVANSGAVTRTGRLVQWQGGCAQASEFVDLAGITRCEQSCEILGLEMARSLPVPVLADFSTGTESWDAYQHVPLGDERVYVRKRRCRGEPLAELTTGFGEMLSALIAY